MLEMKNVVKTFGTFRALDELSLTVPKAQFTVWWAPTVRANPRPSVT